MRQTQDHPTIRTRDSRERSRQMTAPDEEPIRWPEPSPLTRWWQELMASGGRNAAP